ncbi:MAG: lysophospholipid acyltransferase family protein [Victivallales bacterium]
MAIIRRISRIFLLTAWMLIIWIFMILLSFGRYWKVQRRFGILSLVWGKGLAWIFGIKTKIVGDTGDFKGGLVVSNHSGYIDILVHAAVFPIRFAPKSGLRKWPVIGWFLICGRPIWVDRSSPRKSKVVAQQFKDSMDNGIPLLVYPEGTSTDCRHGILKFKSTPFAAAGENNNWILPTIIRYGDTPDGKPVAWYGDMTLLPHLWRILGYKEIRAEVTIMKPFKPDGRDRKELAEFTHRIMAEEYEKIYKSEL